MTTKNEKTERPKILLLDDDEQVRTSLEKELEVGQFRVTTAASVGEALHLIDTEPFEVLLCDLHTPGAGDSFTVVSRMRRTNPNAVTLVSTSHPALGEVIETLRSQVDEILVKPLVLPALAALIREKLQKRGQLRLYHCNQYSADSACQHCGGVIRHEPWCVRQNAAVACAFRAVLDAAELTLEDQLILHALGVAWAAEDTTAKALPAPQEPATAASHRRDSGKC